MPLEISEFEIVMVITYFAALLALCLGVVLVFEIRERRSPVGRLSRRRGLEA